jgi:hypothetical protein
VAPQAPVLPFTYLGKQFEAGEWSVFLADQERTYVVKENTTIESTYLVEKITPKELVITHLPLKQQQSIVIGTTE